MDILDDMGVSKLSAKVFLKVNYSFKSPTNGNINYRYSDFNRIWAVTMLLCGFVR